MKATKRPWSMERRERGNYWIVTPTRSIVADVDNIGIMAGRAEANARLIVLAINHFEEMVEALKFSLSVHKSQGQFDLSERMAVDKLSALLAKIKEG